MVFDFISKFQIKPMLCLSIDVAGVETNSDWRLLSNLCLLKAAPLYKHQ